MGQPGGSSYDGDGMKAVADSTRRLSSDLGEMRGHASDRTMTPAAFGNIGDLTNVKTTFERTWSNLADSLGKASAHVGELAQKVESAFAEQDKRDQGSAQDMGKLDGEM